MQPPRPSDEGDEAQIGERLDLDLSFTRRERLAARIDRLTRAPERLAQGTCGACEACGAPIGQERLAAIPEAATCRRCQQHRQGRAA